MSTIVDSKPASFDKRIEKLETAYANLIDAQPTFDDENKAYWMAGFQRVVSSIKAAINGAPKCETPQMKSAMTLSIDTLKDLTLDAMKHQFPKSHAATEVFKNVDQLIDETRALYTGKSIC